MNDFYAAALGEGFARPGARHTADTFDVVGGPMRIIIDDDTERAADLLRPSLAVYIGGMGARGSITTTRCSPGWVTRRTPP